MPPILELEYDVKMEDAIEFALFHHRQSPSLKKRRRVLRLGLSALLVVMAGVIAGIAKAPVLGLIGFVFALLFWWFFPRRFERGLRETVVRMYSEGKNMGVLGPTKLVLEEDLITESTPTRDVRTRWPAVERCIETPMHVFVYVTGSSALIVPKRDIGEEGAKRLLEEVRSRMPAAVASAA